MVTIDREACINCGSCTWACPTAFLVPGDETPVIDRARGCTKCMHCIAACAQKAVYFEEIPREDTYQPTPEEGQLERIVKLRRSVRRYRRETPDQETVKWALDAARWAPSSKNRQPTHWSVLWGAGKVEQVMTLLDQCADAGNEFAAEMTEMLKTHSRNPITCGAPGAIIAYCKDTGADGRIDCAIATTTLELLLVGRGVATCWGGYLASVLQKCPAIKAYAGIPEDCTAYTVLLIGNADREVYPNVAYRKRADVQWLE